MSYAAIHIPEFPVATRLRLQPGLRSQPAAVTEGSAPLERVLSFNGCARRLGLEHGMSKVQTETLGPVVLCRREAAEEQAAMELVYQIAEQFSPRVQMVASPQNAYAGATQPAALLLLDRRGTERMFGSAQAYAEKLRDALRVVGFPASVATAPNAEASLLLARSYRGATAVDASEIGNKLAPLPISVLHGEPSMLQILERWGIRRLQDLARLPETALISRLGQGGKRLQRLARGMEERLLIPEQPAFVLRDSAVLDSPLECLPSVLFVLSPMLERLLQQATRHAYALRSLAVTLDLERGPAHKLEVRTALPVQDKDLLLKLLHLRLQAEPPRAGIMRVEMEAQPALPAVAQRGLFQSQFPEPDKLDLLTARLRSIAGEGNVGSPALCNSHREDAFQMVPFAPTEAAKEEKPAAPRGLKPVLRRFRPPQRVRILLKGCRPSWLFWKGARLPLLEVAGPWQGGGYWWDGRRWAAEEWDAVVAQPSQALLLRHEPEQNTWYVAGLYD